MALLDLPAEIQTVIAGLLPTPSDKLNFALIHPSLHDLGIEQLYAHLDDQSQRPDSALRFHQLVQSINLPGKNIGCFVRSLALLHWNHQTTPPRWNYGEHFTLVEFGLCLTRPIFVNLKRLEIACPDASQCLVNMFLPQLEELIVSPVEDEIDCCDPPVMDLSFVPDILRLPKLRYLDLSMMISNDTSMHEAIRILGTEPSTALRELHVKAGTFTCETLDYLIGRLSKLEILHLCLWPVACEHYNAATQQMIGHSTSLPEISFIGEQIGRISDTLKVLVVPHGCGPWTPRLDVVGTLAHFPVLNIVAVSIEILLGWNHCEHISSAALPVPPERLASLLPSSLEYLCLFLGDFHYHRNGKEYVLTALISLVEEGKRFPMLKEICIDGRGNPSIASYCSQCKDTLGNTPACAERRTNISVEEKQRIVKMMPAHVKLEFRPETHWKESEQPDLRKEQEEKNTA